jgi:hypothetical protein
MASEAGWSFLKYLTHRKSLKPPNLVSFNAEVELVPVMNGDDLRKGLSKTTSLID